MICEVMKSFEGMGSVRVTGEIVDSSSWPHERKLIENRYLRAAPLGTTVPPRETMRERTETRRRRSKRSR